MAESKSSTAGGLAALLPLALLFAGLLVVWSLSVLWIRSTPLDDELARQTFPLLLWVAAIAAWIAWQRPSRPAQWIGLRPLGRTAILPAVAAFAAVFAWHAIRVALGRMPGGLLMQLPPVIYAWLLSGIFLNVVLFNGILQTRLTEIAGPKVSIPVTAFAVLLFRIPSFYVSGAPLAPEPVMLMTIFLLALLGAMLRHMTRSLWPALALQLANALGLLL